LRRANNGARRLRGLPKSCAHTAVRFAAIIQSVAVALESIGVEMLVAAE
jgi:hypothetical protein